MPTNIRLLRVFIASPADGQSEREAVADDVEIKA